MCVCVCVCVYICILLIIEHNGDVSPENVDNEVDGERRGFSLT